MTVSVPYDTMSVTSQTQPFFTKCCCCIPLRVGCFILGYLSLIFNTFHTLSILIFTTYVGISTHGFDHFDYDRPREISDQTPDIEAVQKPFLNQFGIFLMIVLCTNVAWLVVNVACLVGLHKKRPGPIRVYAAFATVRLLLLLAGFIYVVMVSTNVKTIVTTCVELSVSAYFILVYYIYAMQLERELEQAVEPEPPIDVVFASPKKIDKQVLVA